MANNFFAMPLKKTAQKTILSNKPGHSPGENENIAQNQSKIIDPDNLKVELNQQNDALKKILARLEKKKKP